MGTDQNPPLFTVFTGTYNRGALLRRVYECLLAQTLQDFEWLVVDDGSTDDTRQIVAEMIAEGRLRIRYFYKPNGGVHTAHNVAVQHAAGRFFMRCDSDDEFVPEAMQTFVAAWRSILEERHYQFSGVSCLCMDKRGRPIGDPYPRDGWDSDWRTLSELRGEKWGIHLTRILRDFPFPQFKGERQVPEGVVWGRVHDHYRTRCINVPLRIYHAAPDQLSKKISRLRYSCANAYTLYYAEELARKHSTFRKLKLAVSYVRVTRGLGLRWARIISGSPHKVLTALVAPVGLGLYFLDRKRGLAGPAR